MTEEEYCAMRSDIRHQIGLIISCAICNYPGVTNEEIAKALASVIRGDCE